MNNASTQYPAFPKHASFSPRHHLHNTNAKEGPPYTAAAVAEQPYPNIAEKNRNIVRYTCTRRNNRVSFTAAFPLPTPPHTHHPPKMPPRPGGNLSRTSQHAILTFSYLIAWPSPPVFISIATSCSFILSQNTPSPHAPLLVHNLILLSGSISRSLKHLSPYCTHSLIVLHTLQHHLKHSTANIQHRHPKLNRKPA